MSRLFYHVMQDNVGNLLFDVSGTMRLAGSGTLATIYGDEALSVILPNPMTNHPSFGSFKCFLGAGDYDFYMAKSGYTFETLTGVQGHGTLAQQDATAVAITGGSISVTRLGVDVAAPGVAGQTYLNGPLGIGIAPDPALSLKVAFGAYLVGKVGVGIPPLGDSWSVLYFPRDTVNGMTIRGLNADSGNAHILFRSMFDTIVGAITCTGTTTSYGTTSDARLKHTTTPLTGALDVVRRLRPITHLWRADDSRGYGFVAHEVQDTLPADAGVVTGARDAVDENGQIVPQQIDYGKLVPWLTAAFNDALAMLDTLTTRVAALEQQLGV